VWQLGRVPNSIDSVTACIFIVYSFVRRFVTNRTTHNKKIREYDLKVKTAIKTLINIV